jgi:hypothetical protein
LFSLSSLLFLGLFLLQQVKCPGRQSFRFSLLLLLELKLLPQLLFLLFSILFLQFFSISLLLFIAFLRVLRRFPFFFLLGRRFIALCSLFLSFLFRILMVFGVVLSFAILKDAFDPSDDISN